MEPCHTTKLENSVDVALYMLNQRSSSAGWAEPRKLSYPTQPTVDVDSLPPAFGVHVVATPTSKDPQWMVSSGRQVIKIYKTQTDSTTQQRGWGQEG